MNRMVESICKFVRWAWPLTRYAEAVSSGISPFDPRCAMLYGREGCRGFLVPSATLLGSG